MEEIGIDYYNNDQIRHRITFVNKRRNGLYQSWHKNGWLKTECTYIENKINGTFKKWYKDGTLEVENYFLNGSKHGREIRYSSKDTVIFIGYFKNGMQQGIFQSWQSNNLRKGIRNLKDDQRNGPTIYFYYDLDYNDSTGGNSSNYYEEPL